jgi:hypothetical protein
MVLINLRSGPGKAQCGWVQGLALRLHHELVTEQAPVDVRRSRAALEDAENQARSE